MKKNLPTLSIGIPAHNEEQNIGFLLQSIFEQKIKSALLCEIIVVSDGSTDKTDEIVRSIMQNGLIKLYRIDKRSGVDKAKNMIQEKAIGDILVMLDADTLPVNDQFIEKLINPILISSEVGMTSSTLIPVNPRTFVEKILARNHIFKREMFMKIKDGNNIYTAFGPAIAFSRKLYKSFVYGNNYPFDAYSYIQCLSNSLRFVFVRDAEVIFKCPENIDDHKKQGMRFRAGKKSILKTFGERYADVYSIPSGLFFKSIIIEMLRHPILFMSFCVINLFVCISSFNSRPFDSRWEIASSSKMIYSKSLRQNSYKI